MKKVIAIALSVAALASVSLAFAEELAVKPESDRETFRSKKTELVQEFKAKIGEWKTERQQALESLKQEKLRLRTEFKEKFTADKCAKIEERIQNRTAKFGTSKVKHMSVYNNLLARLDKFIKRFEDFNATSASDVDAAKIAKLKDDRAQLVVLIDAFKTSYDEYSAKLASAKKFTCGSSEGEFRGSLADARTYLKTVHTNAAAIRTYVRGTILPDLLAVKKDIAKIKGETGDENKTDDEDEQDENNGGDEDETDTTLPTVSITSPGDTIYTAAATVPISATAADNKGVARVEFYDGGNLKVSDTTSPYSYDWTFSTVADNGAHPWTAKAYDAAGNSAVSAIVNLTIAIPTPTP